MSAARRDLHEVGSTRSTLTAVRNGRTQDGSRKTRPGFGRRAAVLAFGGLALVSTSNTRPALAEGIDKATESTFQSIITQQMDAFGRDDAVTAQSFAAPGIKSKFPDPQAFNAMVHQTYAPLIHPRSTRFRSGGTTALGPVEKVTIVDSKGQAWTAIYSFEQVDGQWRINGCILVQEQSTSV